MVRTQRIGMDIRSQLQVVAELHVAITMFLKDGHAIKPPAAPPRDTID